jgi:hypothetical protein
MSQERNSQELVTKDTGEGYATETATLSALTKAGLDKKDYTIIPYEGGFAAKKKNATQDPEPEKKEVSAEKFFRVRFHAKSHSTQQDNVELSVNGETLLIEREKVIVIPERFIECANHATYPQFKQLPNAPRKIVGRVMIFPFDILGEGTKMDFLKQKTSGTKENEKALKTEQSI